VPVVLQNRQRVVAIDRAWLRRTADAVLSAARADGAELSLVLVSDRRIRALNRRYRKKDRPTDVLAFPLGGQIYFPRRKINLSPFPPVLLGDVVISVPMARRHAADLGHGLREELRRLLVHGVLHLLGYDHERGPRDAALMARKEKAILRMTTPEHVTQHDNVGAGNPAKGLANQFPARSKKEGVNPSPTRK
jgi:probable rRNA maturation factor